MKIKVIDVSANEEIFNGDAEDFLYDNDCDEELENLLDKLSYCRIGQGLSYFGNQCSEYRLIKDIDIVYE